MKTLGCTAMGPATLSSILLASEHKLGSNVVLCTDGEANQGLGAFGYGYGNSQDNDAAKFYERMGKLAADKGVALNLIAVVGS